MQKQDTHDVLFGKRPWFGHGPYSGQKSLSRTLCTHNFVKKCAVFTHNADIFSKHHQQICFSSQVHHIFVLQWNMCVTHVIFLSALPILFWFDFNLFHTCIFIPTPVTLLSHRLRFSFSASILFASYLQTNYICFY